MIAAFPRLSRGIFGALVLGALGFGAGQALASPTVAVAAGCTRAEASQCSEECRATFGGRAGGICTRTAEGVTCECYVTQI